ncbi:Hydroxyacid-oxoacid transhydrogenase, mitochondrial [Pteropus alecto]|uniref:Hydroxyacid-oxoacid transhydrogenase, mitochondrial n=2 Tax=Laurasiatheria TaxID=314145 RepID=L5JSH6_PTEAL|nr:Hydroxyacid-oxoacid transhydrogenase, mitochondrial [Pteropus alecto]
MRCVSIYLLDLQNMGAKNVCLMTDKNLSQLPPVQIVMDSLVTNGINFKVYDNVRVEPTDRSFLEAIEFARKGAFDAYVAVGGGSTMDTCKAANLYASSLHSDFLDYVSAPIGKGKPVSVPLKPLIAGIASRALKPTLGLVDPRHTLHMPGRVVANSGFDVLCHALESYSALPYHMRSPCPSNPIFRPAYQGSNPVSDIWAVQALRIVAKYLKRAVRNPDDLEARSNMHLASTFAGIGFGNAGVHLCHGMSYPISGLVKTYKAKDYNVDHPLVPHGLSVVLTSPAVFTFTAQMFPERHLEMAEILGADTRTARAADAGPVLADTLRKFLFDLDVDDGLAAIGYSKADIPALVKGTLPQVVIESDLYSPRPLELLPHRSDRRASEGRRSSRLQSSWQQGPHAAKNPSRPVGIAESKSSNLCGNRAYGKSLIPPVARISVKAPAAVLEAAATGSENRAVLTRGSRHLKKMTEEYPTLPQGAEASLPLTGSASCGVPSILRKMWTRHKKKSEYVGATNSAFEAD